MSKQYTVWVGGSEVNEFYLTYQQAVKVAESWKDDGYDDVVIEEIK